MRPINIFLSVILLISAAEIDASSWFVDNRPGATVKDFTSLSDAITASAVGDTILLAGSPWEYCNNFTITKNVVIIGPGYFLNENFPGISVQYTALLTNIIFGTGSSGAQVSGCTVQNGCDIAVSNIGIFRNRITCQIILRNSVTDVLLKGNFIQISSTSLLMLGDNCFNILIQNNYLYCNSNLTGSSPLSSGIMFSNNIIDLSVGYGFSIYNSVFANNIFIGSPSLPASTNEYYNNLSNYNNLPTGNNNLNGVDISTVFTMSGSPDGYYRLKAGSPAIGAGQNGIDIGMYGGMAPYVMSGISLLPKVYSLEILNITPQALTARVRAGATLNQPIPPKVVTGKNTGTAGTDTRNR